MTGLGETTAALARFKRGVKAPGGSARDRLTKVEAFGDNPGALALWTYRPANTPPHPALVVVLHGCTQSAEAYAHGAGWLTLADRYGFLLLCPEQSNANNLNRCFNWFEPGDQRRGGGEAASIAAMIQFVLARDQVDPKRVFITGLSAGGGMANVMLASYPEVFAAGSIVAGLPYGAAGSVQSAFTAMFHAPSRPDAVWRDAVRSASSYEGPWPSVSVWHGDADYTVAPANGDATAAQWAAVHGASPASPERFGRTTRTIWSKEGRVVVERWVVGGLGHGVPLATAGQTGCGAAGPYMLEAGVSSSVEMAKAWGLAEETPTHPLSAVEMEAAGSPTVPRAGQTLSSGPNPLDIQAVITKALTAAGLMRAAR